MQPIYTYLTYAYRYRNVQVTLHILRELIDKSPRDLSLYAPYVLRILSLIVRSNDLSMVEDSIPTFEAFCEHYSVAALAVDQEHIRQFQDLAKFYAELAAKPPLQIKGSLSAPIAIRWKSVGLTAIKSITSSDAVVVDTGRYLHTIVPIILQNLCSDKEDYLLLLQRRTEANNQTEKDAPARRRMSIATVQTVETSTDRNPAAVSGTAADADRVAEEEVGILALQSLKQIFVTNNRGQIRMATAAILDFICGRNVDQRPTAKSTKSSRSTWATSLVDTIARSTPVQDRFVILVTTVETLLRNPVVEENLAQHLKLVGIIGWLLSSNINMIGLSVMDVLLGLIQHILQLLQLGGKGSNVLPHHQKIDAIDFFKERTDVSQPSPKDERRQDESSHVTSPSVTRQELLASLGKCIGDLATHIYYSEQISDIITAILLRLKPSPLSNISSAIAAIERPAAAAQAISSSVNLQEDPKTDDFFSFGTARVTALTAVKNVLTVANQKGSFDGAGAVGRNRVGVRVWEGTQWLLRDEDRRVRRAYVDALLTWLKFEVSKADSRIIEDKPHESKVKNRVNNDEKATNSTRRAISNASHRSKSSKIPNATFLQLLHLAIYDDALEIPQSNSNISLLHLLMTNLIEKLGVNAVKCGLPMIMRLQEDINMDELVKTPTAKLNLGSLVHGYLWALTERFDFDTTAVGYEIHMEISRRKKHGLWSDAIQMPPLPMDQISSMVTASAQVAPLQALQTEFIKPFDSCPAMISQISQSYASSVATPSVSPPSSPGRVYNIPVFSSQSPAINHQLPGAIKEAMLRAWTKESCIASMEQDSASAASLHGSRTNTNRSNGLLTTNGHTSGEGSPAGSSTPGQMPLAKTPNQDRNNQPDSSPPLAFQPLLQEQLRRSSAHNSESATPLNSSDHQPTVRVDDLKRVLAGGALSDVFSPKNHNSGVRNASPLRKADTAYQDFADSRVPRTDGSSISAGTDSIVSAEGFESASEGDSTHPLPPLRSPLSSSSVVPEHTQQRNVRSFEHVSSPSRGGDSRPGSRDQPKYSRPRTSSSASEDPEANARALKGELAPSLSRGSGGTDDEEVPPVPPLPPSLSIHSSIAWLGKPNTKRMSNGAFVRPATAPSDTAREKPSTRERSLREASNDRTIDRSSLNLGVKSDKDRRKLMQQLLSGIEASQNEAGSAGRPPY